MAVDNVLLTSTFLWTNRIPTEIAEIKLLAYRAGSKDLSIDLREHKLLQPELLHFFIYSFYEGIIVQYHSMETGRYYQK